MAAADNLGAEVNVQNANGDVEEQIEQIRYLIKKKVDVMVVVAADCMEISEVMLEAKAAGIPTISYDRLIQNADTDLYISFDNEKVGQYMAEVLVENIPEGGKIFMIQGPEEDNNVKLVRKGFEEGLEGSKIEVVYKTNCQGWLAEQAVDPAFWATILNSFARISLGFLGAFFLSILLGSLAYLFPLVKELLDPVMLLIKSVPVASFVILALIWIGSRNLAVFTSFLVVVPMVYVSTLSGLKHTDKKLLEMARVFRMPMWKRIHYIYVPALLPYIVNGCRTALGMSWKSGVAAEVIGIPEGSIGEQLYYSKLYLDTAGLFAWTFVIIIISALFERFFLYLLKKIKH